MNKQALPYVTFVAFLFGSTLVASRFAVGQFSPTTYIGLRLFMASLAHVLVYLALSAHKIPRNGRLWGHALVLGLFGTAIPITAVDLSLQYLSSGVAAILVTTSPAIMIVLAHFFLPDEGLTWTKLVGVLLALFGTALLAGTGESGIPQIERANPLGYLLMMVAIVLGSSAAVYIRKYLMGYDSFDVASLRMFVAATAVLPLSLLLVGFDLSAVTTEGYVVLIYAAIVGTFGGMLLSVYNIKRFGTTAAVIATYMVPIVTVVCGALFLHEQITPVMVMGMGLIFLGVAVVNRVPVQLRQMKADSVVGD